MKLNAKLLGILLLVGITIIIVWYSWPRPSELEDLESLGFNQKAWQAPSGDVPMVVISAPTEALRTAQNLRRYQYLEEAIQELPNVQRVITVLDAWKNIHPSAADPSSRFLTIPDDSEQLDSILHQTSPLGKQLINVTQTATFMVIVFQQEALDAQQLRQLMDDILMLSEQFSQVTDVPLRYGAADALQSAVR